jgi:glycosyltransferase involved in cell wall biosynthesis
MQQLLPSEDCIGTGDPVRVSVVVACRNEIQHIRQFLDSLLGQDLSGLTWEAIIVDGLSNDGTREVLEQYSAKHPQIRMIDNPGRFVSSGLNSAIRAAQGEIILRMDAHTYYSPDYCRRCIETLAETGADNVGGPARTKAEGICARAVAAAYHSPFSTGGAKFHDCNYEGWVDTVTYGCWRKSTLIRLGLFDESLVRNQDDELNLRLVRAGGRIWQNPRIISWYSPRTTLSGLFRQYFQYGFWKVAVIRKHRIPGSWRHAAPVLFVLANLAAMIGLVASMVAHSPQWAIGFASFSAVMLTCYGAVSVVASAVAARTHGWDIFLYLPAAFATYHFAWGLGFFFGIFRWSPRSGTSLPLTPDSAFTKLSR